MADLFAAHWPITICFICSGVGGPKQPLTERTSTDTTATQTRAMTKPFAVKGVGERRCVRWERDCRFYLAQANVSGKTCGLSRKAAGRPRQLGARAYGESVSFAEIDRFGQGLPVLQDIHELAEGIADEESF